MIRLILKFLICIAIIKMAEAVEAECCSLNTCNFDKIDIVSQILEMAHQIQGTIQKSCLIESATNSITATTPSTISEIVNFSVIDGFTDQSQVDYMVPVGLCYNLPAENIEQHRHFIHNHDRCFIIYLGPDCTGEPLKYEAQNERQDVPVPWFDTFLSFKSC